jgi:hypothetical protein
MALFYAASIFLASSFSNACNRLMASRISPRALSASSRERVLMPPTLTLSSCAFVRACVAHFKRLLAICFSSVCQRKRLAARRDSRHCLIHGEEMYGTILSRSSRVCCASNGRASSRVAVGNDDCGSREAVTRPPFPQNLACEFPVPRYSVVGSQHCGCLRLPVREAHRSSSVTSPRPAALPLPSPPPMLLSIVRGFLGTMRRPKSRATSAQL